LVTNSKGSSLLSKEVTPLGSVYIPHVRGVSKFRRIGNWYNIKAILRMKHTLRSALMRTGPERDLQQMAQCTYRIPCECDRSYTDETGRPLAVWVLEHRHNLKEGLLEKSKLAQHAYKEGHMVVWAEARILQIESNSRHRK
jgi:AraC-like DNA-binding protein